MTKKRTETESPKAQAADAPKFFEIVNWKKLQNMEKPDAPWLKLYTSILDNDKIDKLDNASYRLLNGIWALAARLGKHILPADPKWLMKRIAFLKEEPDLQPLFDATNMYGYPEPFLRLCEAPGPDDSGKSGSSQQAGDSGGDGGSGKADRPKDGKRTARKPAAEKEPLYEKAVVVSYRLGYASARAIANELGIKYERARRMVKSMVEAGLAGGYVHGKGRVLLRAPRADREETETETEQETEQEIETDPAPLRASGQSSEERKSLSGFPKDKEAESTAEQSSQEQTIATADQSSQEPEKPENPTNSDAGGAEGHIVPMPPRSVTRQPQALGAILGERFKPWWIDRDCEDFGWEIVGALGYSTDRLNVESRNQWGNFAAWWWWVKQVAPVGVLGELRAKAVEKAAMLRKKKSKHPMNPGKVWDFIMKGELASHGVCLPDSRAGPAAAKM